MFLITLFREKSVNKGYVHIYGLLMTSEYISILHCNANSLSQEKLIGKPLKSAIRVISEDWSQKYWSFQWKVNIVINNTYTVPDVFLWERKLWQSKYTICELCLFISVLTSLLPCFKLALIFVLVTCLSGTCHPQLWALACLIPT